MSVMCLSYHPANFLMDVSIVDMEEEPKSEPEIPRPQHLPSPHHSPRHSSTNSVGQPATDQHPPGHHSPGHHSPGHHRHHHHPHHLSVEEKPPETETSSSASQLLEPPPPPPHKGQRKHKRRKKVVKRHVAETHILGRQFRDPTVSFHTLHKTLIPSVNPVKASIEKTLHENAPADGFIVHYNRYLHSHQTIDSRHELHYKKFGLPKKPSYNPQGRRFTDSSESDPDYDREEFQKLATELNAKKSDDEDDSEEDEEEESHVRNIATVAMAWRKSTNKPAPKPTGNKVHPEGHQIEKKDSTGFAQLMSSFCCCCKKPRPDLPVSPRPQLQSVLPELSNLTMTTMTMTTPTTSEVTGVQEETSTEVQNAE